MASSAKRADCNCNRSYDTAHGSNGSWKYCPYCGTSLYWYSYSNVPAVIKGINVSDKREPTSKEPRMRAGARLSKNRNEGCEIIPNPQERDDSAPPRPSWPRHHDNLPPMTNGK